MTSLDNNRVIIHLLESGLDFILNGVKELEERPKYSVVHFAIGVELVLKAGLMMEHWTLIIDKPENADLNKFRNGDCNTVSLTTALARISKICGFAIEKTWSEAVNSLNVHRNKMIHFYHKHMVEADDQKILEQMTSDQCRCWLHLSAFLRAWFIDEGLELEHILWSNYHSIERVLLKNRRFLTQKWDTIQGSMDVLRAQNLPFSVCNACGFRAVRINKSRLLETHSGCWVCDETRRFIRVNCSNSCDGFIEIADWSASQFNCNTCKATYCRSDLLKIIDTYDESKGWCREWGCARCEVTGTIVKADGKYICFECSFGGPADSCPRCRMVQINSYELNAGIAESCVFCNPVVS